MSKWEQFQFASRIEQLLKGFPTDNRVGYQFLTPYQIALALVKKYPDIAGEYGQKVGGKGSNVTDSLAKYVADQLAKEKSPNVEIAFLSSDHLTQLTYENNVVSSTRGRPEGETLFRYRPKSSEGQSDR
jgi:hypothetical protein